MKTLIKAFTEPAFRCKESVSAGNICLTDKRINAMELNEEGLRNRDTWEKAGYRLPHFDRENMLKTTHEKPVWVHFGAGNIFRAFHANIAQKLLNAGSMTSGITVVEGFDYEIIEKEYRPHDNYSLLVTLRADGSVEKTVIGSIGESCVLDSANAKEFGRLKEIFRAESLQMATFTITEKGYSLVDSSGELLANVKKDFTEGPDAPSSYIGKVASLLYERFLNGGLPIAMVSTDNCSHNGDRLYDSISRFAQEWAKNGLASEDFVKYVDDRDKVSFPWSMIDKITPRPDKSVENILKTDGFEHLETVVTSKSTYVAPFVNAEETEYLVIEDAFPAGRPALEKAGVILADKETVDKVERMKVCTCLNPLHTALAVFGCLLGYDRISEEMKDPDLVKLIERIGYVEGLPVVMDPGVIDPGEFIDTVLKVRLPNPFMPDAPQRIATDTSQKLPIRFGETIRNYINTGRNIHDLKMIPLVFSGWLRYLMAVDDKGEPMELSPDPMSEYLTGFFADISLGDKDRDTDGLKELLSDERIFGVDLYEVGLAGLVLDYYRQMCKGPGAVRETLRKYTSSEA